MQPIKLRYEGCAVEAEIIDPGSTWPEWTIRVFDPKGVEIFDELGEMLGRTILEMRLTRMMPEPFRSEYRERLREDNLYRARIVERVTAREQDLDLATIAAR